MFPVEQMHFELVRDGARISIEFHTARISTVLHRFQTGLPSFQIFEFWEHRNVGTQETLETQDTFRNTLHDSQDPEKWET